MADKTLGYRHSREGGNPASIMYWISAFAGMTVYITF